VRDGATGMAIAPSCGEPIRVCLAIEPDMLQPMPDGEIGRHPQNSLRALSRCLVPSRLRSRAGEPDRNGAVVRLWVGFRETRWSSERSTWAIRAATMFRVTSS
jgi:hypothetical protein